MMIPAFLTPTMAGMLATGNALLLSSSRVHGGGFFEYAFEDMDRFLGDRDQILFIPYARPGGRTHQEYTTLFREKTSPLGREVVGIEEHDNPVAVIQEAPVVFVGGGNTFVLQKELHRAGLVEAIRRRVLQGQMLYMGASAGSNVAGLSIGTSNDMPIVFPPTFDALGLLPFNINPHYLDPDPDSTHKGETREERIGEFLIFNHQPVVALREGAMLRIGSAGVELMGMAGARLFRRGIEPEEFQPGQNLKFLLNP